MSDRQTDLIKGTCTSQYLRPGLIHACVPCIQSRPWHQYENDYQRIQRHMHYLTRLQKDPQSEARFTKEEREEYRYLSAFMDNLLNGPNGELKQFKHLGSILDQVLAQGKLERDRLRRLQQAPIADQDALREAMERERALAARYHQLSREMKSQMGRLSPRALRRFPPRGR